MTANTPNARKTDTVLDDKNQKLNILMAASEIKPYSGNGGMGMVTQALTQKHAENGHDVGTISPWYTSIETSEKYQKLPEEQKIKIIGEIDVPFKQGFVKAEVGRAVDANGIEHLFVKNDDLYTVDYDVDEEKKKTPKLYGYENDDERFAFFSRAIPQAAALNNPKSPPDVVHCHDWQTGIVPAIIKHGAHLPRTWQQKPPATMMTLHRGEFDFPPVSVEHLAHLTRLPNNIADIAHLEYGGKASTLWSGVGEADRWTTVSGNYFNELIDPNGPYMNYQEFADKGEGIVNGINTRFWDGSTTNPKEQEAKIAGKIAKREELYEKNSLEKGRPLIGVVSRISEEKGMGILIEAIPELVEKQDWNLIVGGKVYSDELDKGLREMADRFPENVKYSPGWIPAKDVFEAADCNALPSKSEPCGLTQMEGQTEAVIAIARKTGGLVDTIKHGVTGFLFEDYTKDSLLEATREAKETMENAPEKWKQMQRNSLALDNSWDKSAESYVADYQAAIEANKARIQQNSKEFSIA